MPALRQRLSEVTDYPALLESCWQEHLAPRAEDAPTVISTFAGAGGSSLGYSMAGFRELLAVEWDDNAVATFRLNFPDVPVYHGDIAMLSVEDVLSLTGLQPGQLDVFDGSPPCQGFSTAGKRNFNDDRNQLFREYVRLLRGLQPKVFVMENVSGMVKGKMKLIFVDILRELKASGYVVSARLLNAMYFGVPQSRERMIFIGVREDLGIAPSHPKAESRPVTVRDAWRGVSDDGKPLPESAVALARLIPPGDSNGGGKYSKGLNGTTNNFGLSRLAWNKPSCTIPKTSILVSSILQPDRDERLSIEQVQRIGSYPDAYVLLGDFNAKWARIGNSVPPLFMRSIARHIRSEILGCVSAVSVL